MVKFAACHLGVYLCRGDIRVTENLANDCHNHLKLKTNALFCYFLPF